MINYSCDHLIQKAKVDCLKCNVSKLKQSIFIFYNFKSYMVK